MSGVRPAARLARREVARRPGRSVLVALLVAVPVAAMLVASVLVRTEHISPLERWSTTAGRADAVVGSQNNVPSTASSAEIRAIRADRSVKTVKDYAIHVYTTADGHSSDANVAIVPMLDPLTQGMFDVTSGRGPSAPDEVFLTRAAAHDLRVGVGQQLHLTTPTRRTFRVTGVGEEAAQFGQSEIVLPPSSAWRQALPEASVDYLVDLPSTVSTARVQQLSQQLLASATTQVSLQISPRLVPLDNVSIATDADTKVRWSWVFGAVALTVTGIVIAAAFAVGARRQIVTLGLLSSNGASPRVLYLVLVLQGMWTGLIGAVLGVGLGAGVLAVVRTHIEDIFGHVAGSYVFRGTDLIPIVVLGVVAATIAAAVPARTATRVPVLGALAGRRPLGRVPAWLPVVGVVTVVVGLATLVRAVDESHHSFSGGNWHLLLAVAGCVLVLLGGCGIAAGLVSLLEPTAARTVGALRVATRSLARQRTRTAAVVSAVAATGALAIAGSSLVLGQHAAHLQKASSIAPDQVAVSGEYLADGSLPPSEALVAKVERVVPGAERIPTRVVADDRKLTWLVESVTPIGEFDWGAYQASGVGPTPSITVADPSTVALWRLSDSDQRALARNGWLVFGHSKGQITFTLGTRGPDDPTVTMAKPIAHVHAELLSGLTHQTAPAVVITQSRAAQLGLELRVSTVFLKSPAALTSAQRTAIDAIPESTSLVTIYIPPRPVDPFLGAWALVGISLALVLFVIATNLGLSAAESRDERDVLTVVGAPPGATARTNGYKALIQTLMGGLLAIPIGFLPVAVYVHASPGVIPRVFPWRLVTLLVLAVPLVAGLIVALSSAVALRARPVRISTMAYD